VCLLSQIGFAAERNVTGLKQSESGVPRENLALMAVPLIPITITVLLIVTRYTSHQRPLDVLLQTMPFRCSAKQFAVKN